MFESIFQHKIILADQVRMEAYKKAIQEVVKKGDVVADIGTGSGILAFFAVQAGAKKVYAVEQNEIIEEAKKLAKINGLDKRIVFIKGRSDRVEVPEQVDVITSELIGFFGLEENLHRFKIDARKRFLKPRGRLVPSWLELFLVPVESEAILKDNMGLWSNDYYGCDFSLVRSYAVSQRYVTDCSGKMKLLAPSSMISHLNFYEIEKVPSVFHGEYVINKNGIFHGLVGYFQAGLSQSVVLSTSPENPLTHWKQTFFPLKEGVMVEDGDEVCCKIIAIPYGGALFWQWETGVFRKGDEIAKFSQNNLSLRKEEFLIRKKGFKPSLNLEGEICRRVFELCDGKRTTEDIAEILWKEYPKKYKDTKEALEAVVGIVRGRAKLKLK
jgi:protein arginine N-methyltransferase 1